MINVLRIIGVIIGLIIIPFLFVFIRLLKLLGFNILTGGDIPANNLIKIIENENTSVNIRHQSRIILKDLYLSGTLSHDMMDKIENKCPYLIK